VGGIEHDRVLHARDDELRAAPARSTAAAACENNCRDERRRDANE
jgi:hypothetical protein